MNQGIGIEGQLDIGRPKRGIGFGGSGSTPPPTGDFVIDSDSTMLADSNGDLIVWD